MIKKKHIPVSYLATIALAMITIFAPAGCVTAPAGTNTTPPTIPPPTTPLPTTPPPVVPPPVMPPPTTPPATYAVPQLKYLLIAEFGVPFYVDFDFYPVARVGVEEQNALAQFPVIQADTAEFSAILNHLGLPNKADYTTNETISIYREHKTLTLGISMNDSGDGYQFVLRIGRNQGELIAGNITTSGAITVTARQPSFNTYPICLTQGTIIAVPGGQVPVEQITAGMLVWTVDDSGQRVTAPVEKTVRTPVPPSFQVVKVTLSDGRSVTASPGHPTADSRPLGDYHVGDTLDGALVTSVDRVAYDGGATYDLLPSGTTGLYWANGVLLMSTLTGN